MRLCLVFRQAVMCISAVLSDSSLQAIAECLAEPEVSQTEHAPLLLQLLSCVSAIIDTVGESCTPVSHLIFTILLRVAASRHIKEEQVSKLLVDNVDILYCLYR